MPGLLLYFLACVGVPLAWGLGAAWYLARQDRERAAQTPAEPDTLTPPEYEI